MNLDKAEAVRRSIVSTVWPEGAVLKCTVCSHTERVTSEQAATFLRRGWPSHCDRTMDCDKPNNRYELTPLGRAALDPEEPA